MPVPTAQQKIRFGAFELDRQTAELWKNGTKLKLQGQPIAVLALLLERPGELVTREELRKHLWPEDTFVDFENNLNTHIKKLRQVFDDAAETPRYIETLPRRGYRFVAQVDAASIGNAVVADAGNAGTLTTADSATQTAPPEPSLTLLPKPRRWKYAAAAAVILASAGAALYWLYRPRTPVVTGIHQLTRTGYHKSSIGYHPPLTDGTRVYFHEFKSEFPRIAQVSTKGGDVSYFDTPLIQNPYLADIASDGSELLIEDWSGRPEDPFWIFPLPNGPAQKFAGNYWFLEFLPGDKQFVGIKNKQLFILGRDGGQTRQPIPLPDSFATDFPQSFTVSPDGKRIRFATSDHRMWESNLDGSGKSLLVPDYGEPVCCGTWNADGSIFIFSREGRDSDNLWAVTERGLPFYRVVSGPVQLTNGPMPFRFSTVSKDGKQIFALGETMRGELSVYDAQSGELRPFLNGISAGFVDFSKDGQWITYVDYPQGTLWRSRLDGSQRLQLTLPSLGVILNPKWSPDGRFVVFSSWPNSESSDNRIYLVPADGGAPMLLLSGDFQPNDPTWSPDGKSIAYGGVSAAGGEAPFTEIRILDLETKESKSIPGSKGLYSPRWSPDGRFLAATSNNAEKLLIYSFQTQLWTELPVGPMQRSDGIDWPAWSHDSRYLYAWRGTSVYRYRIPDGGAELVFSTSSSEIVCPVFRWDTWFGLTPDDRIMVLHDRGFDELYALDLEYR